MDMFTTVVFPVLVYNAIGGVVFASWLASVKNREAAVWGVLGFLFGVLAVLAVGLSPIATKGEDWTCDQCSTVNVASRTTCLKCGAWRRAAK